MYRHPVANSSEMPKGVEHFGGDFLAASKQIANSSEMPQGVEHAHCKKRGRTMGGEFIRDAERRCRGLVAIRRADGVIFFLRFLL